MGNKDDKKVNVNEDIYQVLKEIAKEDEVLASAFEAWEDMSLDKNTSAAYEARLEEIQEEEKRISELKEQLAYPKPIVGERAKYIRKLFRMGMSDEQVVFITQLPEKQIKQFRNSLE